MNISRKEKLAETEKDLTEQSKTLIL